MVEIIYPDGNVYIHKGSNLFRYTEITRQYKKVIEERSLSPSGGDDTNRIQEVLDTLSEAKLVLQKTKLKRKWKWPWQYRLGLNELKIVQTSRLSFDSGVFNISETLTVGSHITIEYLHARGELDNFIKGKGGIENTVISNCVFERSK